MGIRQELKFDDLKLSAELAAMPEKVDMAITAVFERQTAIAETMMKQQAPWTDRTSVARNGLGAVAEHFPLVRHILTLFGMAAYQIWLEIRWSGKYAIIGPQTPVQGRLIMEQLDRLFRKMR